MIYSEEKNSFYGGALFSVLLLPSVETAEKESFARSRIRSFIIPFGRWGSQDWQF